ncbi:MAG: TetR/AcrR family transcriptional regulator [Oscillospiraceae bacterium]|nr:TetR/AcrR family transcriptional regulator [Oscillospiraceae bacterium]
MEKSNTREEILEAALDLFAVHGYEATSISQLADAVGLRKASLYSHFANKRDILDTVVETVLKGYADHSIFVRADWDDPEFTKDKTGMNAEDAAQLVQGQMRYILHDPRISKGRKMLVIEQFRNAELAELQTKQNYEDVLKYFMGMMRFLIRAGTLRNADAEIMAAQFSSPITVWINLCDREPKREDEVMELVRKHVIQFFEIYRRRRTDGCERQL